MKSVSSRRSILKMLSSSCIGAIGWPGHRAVAQSEASTTIDVRQQTLRALAMRRKILFGSAAVSSVLSKDPKMAEIYARETAIVVADYEMKWGVVRPREATYSYDGADAIVDFAEKHGLLVRGHNLAWEESNPAWMNSVMNSSNAKRYLVDHIERLVGRYRGRIHSWDVVNEPIWPDHQKPNGLRDGIWLKTLGPSYINTAFEAARSADPNALLVLNEAGTEDGSSALGLSRRQDFIALLDRLQAQHTPVDAVGLECHFSARQPFDAEDFVKYLSALSDRGYKILITELDVSDIDVDSPDIDERDEAVAQRYAAIAKAALSNPNLIAILTWELCDKYSWMADATLPKKQRRKDNSPLRPLLFDDALERKKSWYALAGAFS